MKDQSAYRKPKQFAILSAATNAIAKYGASASTPELIEGAGIAIGTLYRYYASKDALLNAVFLHLNRTIRLAMPQLKNEGLVLAEMRHLWDAYVRWAVSHTVEYRAVRRLNLSERLTVETRACTVEMFADLSCLFSRSIANSRLESLGMGYVIDMFFAAADVTIDHSIAAPPNAALFREVGFTAMSNGLYTTV